jgi:hypothetical protein
LTEGETAHKAVSFFVSGGLLMALKTKHLFPFLRMIKKLNIKDDFKRMTNQKADVTGLSEEEKLAVMQDKGVDLFFLLIEKSPDAEKEIFEFLSVYVEKSVDEIEEQDIMETKSQIEQLFKERLFTDFFQRATK